MRKKCIVENDKAKIERVISELDEKKKEALRQAWENVSSFRYWLSSILIFMFFDCFLGEEPTVIFLFFSFAGK